LERVKALPRDAAAADAESYRPELLGEEEPRYLRRQKPVEIKRRKFGKRAWKLYFRVAVIAFAAGAGAWILYGVAHYLLASPEMALVHPQQLELSGNQYVSRASVLEVFAPDRGRSILRVPLDLRRRQLETIPWVARAAVRRALPNRIQVEITERMPVAFLRQGTELALVDGEGMILERPLEGDFHFPVVTGISAQMPVDQRALRMKLFTGFLEQINQVKPGASAQISEVGLADARDLRAAVSGLPGRATPNPPSSTGAAAEGPILVYFGDHDFAGKFRLLLDNIAQWRTTAGRVESVDLRFSREVVVNPEPPNRVARKTKAVKPVKAKR
jgi:cell division protein FtsQ